MPSRNQGSKQFIAIFFIKNQEWILLDDNIHYYAKIDM